MSELPPQQKLLVHTHSIRQRSRCRRCNRRLTAPKWRRLGFGKICAEKALYERAMRGR